MVVITFLEYVESQFGVVANCLVPDDMEHLLDKLVFYSEEENIGSNELQKNIVIINRGLIDTMLSLTCYKMIVSKAESIVTDVSKKESVFSINSS